MRLNRDTNDSHLNEMRSVLFKNHRRIENCLECTINAETVKHVNTAQLRIFGKLTVLLFFEHPFHKQWRFFMTTSTFASFQTIK